MDRKTRRPFKADRSIKVYESSGYLNKMTPQIRLQGEWLKDLGFEIGDQLNVHCEGGRITITRADEIIV